MMGRKGGNLREMGNTDDLIFYCQILELLCDEFRCFSPDTGIDLIEDQSFFGFCVLTYRFKCQHDAGKLPSGSDLAERLWVLARIGAQEELRSHGIEPVDIRDFIEAAVQSYVQYRNYRSGLARDGK